MHSQSMNDWLRMDSKVSGRNSAAFLHGIIILTLLMKEKNGQTYKPSSVPVNWFHHLSNRPTLPVV